MTRIHLATGDGVAAYEFDGQAWHLQSQALQGEYVSVVAQQPGSDLVLAGTYGNGLFRSVDGGITWAKTGGDMPMTYVRALAFLPDDPSIVLVGAEPATIIRSENGGATWRELPIRELPDAEEWFLPYSPRAGAVRFFTTHADAPGLVYAALEVGGVLKSVDHGNTWMKVSGDFTSGHFAESDKGMSLDVHSVCLHPADPQTIYAATHLGVYRSQDGGETWKHLSNGYTRGVALSPSNPTRVFATPGNGPGGRSRFIMSDDNGDSWRQMADNAFGGTVDFLVLSRHLPGILFAVTPGIPSEASDEGRLFYTPVDTVDWRRLNHDAAAVQWVDVVGQR